MTKFILSIGLYKETLDFLEIVKNKMKHKNYSQTIQYLIDHSIEYAQEREQKYIDDLKKAKPLKE